MVRGCFVSFEKRETGGGSDPGRSCSAFLTQCPEHLPPRENIHFQKFDLVKDQITKIYDFFIFRENFVNTTPGLEIREKCRDKHRDQREAEPKGTKGLWVP